MAAVLRSLIIFIVSTTALYASDIEGEIRIGSGGGFATRARVQLLRTRLVIDERVTGADGRFEFRNVGRGPYIVAVRLEGFVDEEISVNIVGPNYREFVSVTLRPTTGTTDAIGTTLSVAEYQIPREARREYEQGLRDRKRGDCAKAVGHFEKAIGVYGKYGEAFDALGSCLKQLGNLEKAEESFQKAIEYKASIYASMNLADLYEERKQFDEADSVLRQSLAKHPGEGDLYFGIARIHLDRGELKDAEQAGLQAHARVHRSADVHLLLGKIYLRLRRYPDLVTQLETYLVENPKGSVADQVRRSLLELQDKSSPTR